ncbi:hypothetical protein Y88_3464 [Novosphingobium nitrogenifigens DSM 19370]|uniref:Uncharacterized protein n=1 Tax=Novosphingobium nitrogenifigens DSM 19370 TaxID=983920 RepID=F1Z353_9SPHN|nr:hypothetical protein Y88_3464 [Novosphingobium nitrogenifigens DSM 19370]
MSRRGTCHDNPVRTPVRNGMLSPAQFERQQILKAEGA